MIAAEHGQEWPPRTLPGELDHLEWSDVAGPFAALRYGFNVRLNTRNAAAAVSSTLSTLRRRTTPAAMYSLIDRAACGRDGPGYIVYANEERVSLVPTISEAIRSLMWHVNQQAINRTVSTRVVIHAAAAEYQERAVLLPAPMNSGKTTTVAGLLGAGFSYVTDEAAAVDPLTLRIDPYPKPLALDRGSFDVLPTVQPPHADPTDPQWQVPAHHFGPSLLGTGLPASVVVIPRYEAGARTSMLPISRVRVLTHLMHSTFAFADDARRNLATLARVAQRSRGYELTIGDLATAVPMITDVVTSG